MTINYQLHKYLCHVPYTQFPVAQLFLTRSLHWITSCTAISATFTTLNSQLYSYFCHFRTLSSMLHSYISATFSTLNFQLHRYLCHVPYTQFPIQQLSLPRSLQLTARCTSIPATFLHSNPSCISFPATFPSINFQLHNHLCHVPYTQYPVVHLSVPISLQ